MELRNLKLDKSNIIAALVFWGLGTIFGGWLVSIEIQVKDIVKAFELILALSTVIIAGIALHTWKSQILYSEALRAVENLEASFKKLVRISRLHWSESINLARDTSKEYDRENLPSFFKQTEAYLFYVDAWDNMPIYAQDKMKGSQLKPDVLQQELINFLVPIHRDNIASYSPIDHDIASSYSNLYTSGLIAIRNCRP